MLTNKDKWIRDNKKYAYNPWNGVRKLSAIGCYERHNIERDEMYLTDKENKQRNFENSNYSEWNETQIQNKLFDLFNQGYKLLPDESAEQFIIRCDNLLGCCHDCKNCETPIC